MDRNSRAFGTDIQVTIETASNAREPAHLSFNPVPWKNSLGLLLENDFKDRKPLSVTITDTGDHQLSC